MAARPCGRDAMEAWQHAPVAVTPWRHGQHACPVARVSCAVAPFRHPCLRRRALPPPLLAPSRPSATLACAVAPFRHPCLRRRALPPPLTARKGARVARRRERLRLLPCAAVWAGCCLVSARASPQQCVGWPWSGSGPAPRDSCPHHSPGTSQSIHARITSNFMRCAAPK